MLNQFELYRAAIHAGPLVLIRYLRQAFEGTGEARVRVTFDRELCYKVTDEPHVRLGGSGWQHHTFTAVHTILEIKFTGRYPAWLTRLVQGVRAGGDPGVEVCYVDHAGVPARVLWAGFEESVVWIDFGN